MSLFTSNANDGEEEDIWSSSDDENELNNKNSDKENIVHALDPKFVEYITKVKRKLYSEIVLKPPSNSKNAQQMKLLENYKKSLKKIYDMIRDIKDGEYNPDDINMFPIKVRPTVSKLVEWVDDFFRNNTHEDIMPYDFYAHCCLVVHANIQKKELPCSANNV